MRCDSHRVGAQETLSQTNQKEGSWQSDSADNILCCVAEDQSSGHSTHIEALCDSCAYDPGTEEAETRGSRGFTSCYPWCKMREIQPKGTIAKSDRGRYPMSSSGTHPDTHICARYHPNTHIAWVSFLVVIETPWQKQFRKIGLILAYSSGW